MVLSSMVSGTERLMSLLKQWAWGKHLSALPERDKKRLKKTALPEHDAISDSFKQILGVGVDGENMLTVGILLQSRVEVVGKGEALLLWNTT